MNKLDAYKMDGLGNDFIIFDQRKYSKTLTKNQIIKIADRNNIGCDQVIFIDKDQSNDAYLTFYNSDGSEVAACGNGSRCVAYLLMKESKKEKISLKTKNRVLEAKLINDLVQINMGSPFFDWDKIPLIKKMDNKNIKIKIDNENKVGFALNVGNPHIIFFVNNLNHYSLKKIGPELENHKYFPEKCNVTFANIKNDNLIKVKVWERGAGLTKACGTAACATAVAAFSSKLKNRSVDIEFDEGYLNIEWSLDNNIYMTGKVSEIKKIEVNI
jgi:diaminopimelate epimerase